jgi:hypothetical protein
MNNFPSVNIFDVGIPVNNEKISFSLLLFCGQPVSNGKTQHSYSIIGKIEGLNDVSASAEIVSAYDDGNQFRDRLYLQNDQFIFSNLSLTAASFNIKLYLKGTFAGGKSVTAEINVNLKYNLCRFFANRIEAKYALKNSKEPVVMLLQ